MHKNSVTKVIPVKSLRLKKRWSQEELAQLSGLNVRTIQRVEKGQSVGAETLKSLAAVFEVSTDELVRTIEQANHFSLEDEENAKAEAQHKRAIEKVKSIKYFYAFSAFLLTVFVLFMLPNYNGGENAGPLIVVFLSFVGLIAALALFVFQPFGKEWENAKVSQVLKQQSDNQGSGTEY